MSLLELFVEVDDFYQKFERWAAAQQGAARRGPRASLSASEIMTIVIHFHQAGNRDFKSFYQKHVCKHLVAEFPRRDCKVVLGCSERRIAGTSWFIP